MNQKDYEAAQGGLTQNAAIAAILKGRPQEWVPMRELMHASGSGNVHSRIADLRRRGLEIEHRNERHGRAIHSFYRLMPDEVLA